MKKLFGGIFARQQQPSSPPKNDGTLGVSPTSPLPSTAAATGGSHGGKSQRAQGGRSIYKTGPRGSWSTFFAGNAAARSPTPASAAAGSVSAVPTSTKVFRQNLDMLMREVISRMKPLIPKMLESHDDITAELDAMLSIADLAADKLEQHESAAPLEVLKDYFASPEGLALCDRVALPSLLVDFMGRMRVFLVKGELTRMQSKSSDGGEGGASTASLAGARDAVSSMERALEFLMACIIAVTSNVELIEKYRCELPNLFDLVAEEYPPSAVFIRDLVTQALASVPDKNFSAALVWYLHDCNVIAKTVRLVGKYVLATRTTRENAGAALQAYSNTVVMPASRRPEADYPGKGVHESVIAAVSDALGLNKSDANSSSAGQSMNEGVDHDDFGAVNSTMAATKSEVFCFSSYSPLPGLKALIYVLHKTCRYSLVLLGEFQSSGGYAVLAHILQSCDEGDIATYLYLFTLLLPLGTGFSGLCGEDESMATVSTCGARNANAFLAMRDVLLNSIIAFESGDPSKATEQQSEREAHEKEQLVLQLLTTILHVYTSDYDNFVNLEPKTQMLALVLTQLPWIAFPDGQVIVLRIVEYVCGAARSETVLPTDILSVLSTLFIERTTSETRDLLSLPREAEEPSADSSLPSASDRNPDVQPCARVSVSSSTYKVSSPVSLILCGCITKIVRDSPLAHFKAQLRSFGVLERGVYRFLSKIANTLSTIPTCEVKPYLTCLEPHLDMWGSLLGSMLRNDRQACVEFRQLNMHHFLYTIVEALLSNDQLPSSTAPRELGGGNFRQPIMSVFTELASFQPGGHAIEEDANGEADLKILLAGIVSDFTKLLGLLQSLRGNEEKQLKLMEGVAHMLNGGVFVWTAWREAQGCEILISLLSSLDIADSDADDTRYRIMDMALGIYSTTLDPQTDNNANLEYFQREVGYSALASCLSNSGVLASAQLPFVLNRVFELITGNTSPRNKIRNGDAVRVVFQLLPNLPVDEAINTINRLVLKLLSNDEVGFSRKRQVTLLVTAGVFKWIAEPPIMAMLLDDDHPLKQPIHALLAELTKEELSISHLRDFMRIIGRSMPLLLMNRYCSINIGVGSNFLPKPETGLSLLESVFDSAIVPHTKVGTHLKARMASGYVHVVNSTDRKWPPSSGYSFACWMRFPTVDGFQSRDAAAMVGAGSSARLDDNASPTDSGSTVCVALCEGNLSARLDGDDAEHENVYGVLVGAALTIFSSGESATRNEEPLLCLDVTAVAQNSAMDFYFWSHEKRYLVRFQTYEDVDMWWRAMQQSQSISNVTTRQKTAGGIDKNEMLYTSPQSDDDSTSDDKVDGCACILSVYSLESSGCYVRIYFERETGVLRVDTGSVTTGPNMNPTKRNSAVFKSVDIQLLRAVHNGAAPSRDSHGSEHPSGTLSTEREKPSQWHHFAFTHRKTVVGNSSLTLYVDGSEVATKKLSYPSAPTTGTMQAFIGKDIQICGTYPALPWSIGPAWLTEDALPSSAIACMFLLGPSFSGRFSGYAYRSIGDWPEALATTQLDRTTRRRVEVVRAAKRLQLAKLARSSRRTWNDLEMDFESSPSVLGTASAEAPFDSAVNSKKDDAATTISSNHAVRKELQNAEGFHTFIKHECAMSTLGSEILQLLSSFKLADETVLFSINTKFSAQPKSQAIHYIGTEASCPLDLAKLLPSVGGISQVLFPLLENSWRAFELKIVLQLLARVIRRNPSCMAECLELNGYALVASLLCTRSHLIDDVVLRSVVRLAVTGKLSSESSSRASMCADVSPKTSANALACLPTVVDFAALNQVVLCTELRKSLSHHLQCQLLVYLLDLIAPSNPNALFNARQLRRADVLSWILVYLSELGNEECSLDAVASQQLRWCYPQFVDQDLDKVLQYVLSLLRAYVRVENHFDDVSHISEMLLLSLSAEAPQFKNSSIRLVLLQFLLHEIEQDAVSKQTRMCSPAEGVAVTIVNAVIYRSSNGGLKLKRKDRNADGSTSASPMSILSPTGESSGAGFFPNSAPADEFDNVMLEVVAQCDSGPYSTTEALLAVRILLSLAQDFPVFAQKLFQPRLAQKFKRVLRVYSTNYNMYTPLLAFVSNIAIKDTKYYDLEWSPTSAQFQQFALPTPNGFDGMEKSYLTQVWELLGSLMLHNAAVDTEQARAINVTVIGQLSFQIEVSEAFFTAIIASSSIVTRILVQLMVSARLVLRDDVEVHMKSSPQCVAEDRDGSPGHRVAADCRISQALSLQKALMALLTGRASTSPLSSRTSLVIACLDVLRVLLGRLLFEKDECAAFMMFLLECLDHAIAQSEGAFTLSDGQKCWLTLLVHVVKATKALSDNCTLLSLKNVSALAFALARYLVDENKHECAYDANTDEKGRSFESTTMEPSSATLPPRPQLTREDTISTMMSSSGGHAACFGMDVLLFFLSSVRMYAEPHIAQVVGVDDQQFFYSTLVYCAQTVVLSELHGRHKGYPPPQRLLECLTSSRQLLFQQTKCSGVIICGTPVNVRPGGSGGGSVSSDPGGSGSGSGAVTLAGTNLASHLNRMKNPLMSSSGHKEFGLGSESDRSFILSLAAELFLMLADDSESVRHASIALWQYIMQQRLGVLKELLIVEPRVSLLQNMTTSRKEVVDVFHGGFERLLQITTPHSRVTSAPGMPAAFTMATLSTAEAELSRESWLQFHLWLTEEFDLLKELILVRTEPIYQHLVDVLTSCLAVRKVNAGSGSGGSSGGPLMTTTRPKELSLNMDFVLFFDRDTCGKPIRYSTALDDVDVGYKLVARRALVRYSNITQTEVASMSDGLSRWQEMRLRLVHTQSIWQFGGWQSGIDWIPDAGTTASTVDNEQTLDRQGSSSLRDNDAIGLVPAERSIFQQNMFRYRLDFTEGPQRMRIRLMRSYVSPVKSSSDELKCRDDNERNVKHKVADTVLRSTPAKAMATLGGSSGDGVRPNAVSQLYARATQFHEAIDAYREFRFKYYAEQKVTGAGSGDSDASDAPSEALLLEAILRRCKLEATRCIFEDIIANAAKGLRVFPANVARKVFDEFLHCEESTSNSDDEKFDQQKQHRNLLNVSPALIEDIARSLEKAEEEATRAAAEATVHDCNLLQSTLFDAADAEAMQHAICTARSDAHLVDSTVNAGVDGGAPSPPISSDDKNNEVDEEREDEGDATGDEHEFDGGYDDENELDGRDDNHQAAHDSDTDTVGTVIDSRDDERKTSLRKVSMLTSDQKPSEIQHRFDPDDRGDGASGIFVPADAENGEIAKHVREDAITDGSLDFVYGVIARFIQRDDYPPLRSYNAAYIAGMTRFPGIFVLCRGALYFVGGYGKLFNGSVDGNSQSGVASTAAGVFPLFASGSIPAGGSSLLSPTGKSSTSMSGSKKKAKDLIRTTIAEWGTSLSSLSKATDAQPFTVAPLPPDPQQQGSNNECASASLPSSVAVPSTTAVATKSWSVKYSCVKQFCRMKYQLRPVGIEFFDTSGSTFFVQFESHTQREEVLKFVFQMPIVNSIFWNPLLRSSALSLSTKRIRQTLTKRWLRGFISNFEYIMHLNTLAGRSFNDLTQYPVFPWIIADYTSEFLDLDNPKSFRDLSKPMGALHEQRALQFRERYSAMSHDMIGDEEDSHMMAAFHYGTHYSCSAYVVNYLIRLEPYSKLAKELQGGDFDHADRLFRSIPSSWESASRENLQDVRELIPEFFYLPEFLYNANGYALGTTQSGEVVNHVRLPAWAHEDPREFVRVHRQALESRFVSEHLHEWIDLVFGFKQTGVSALAALNVFMPITYEGAVDIDAIKDPVMRAATLAQIENFGQTPSKIFTNPHPARKVPVLVGASTAGGGGSDGGKIGTPLSLGLSQLSPDDLEPLASTSTISTPTGNTLSSVEAYVKWHAPLAPALVSVGKDYVFLKKVMAAKVSEGPIGDIVLVNDKLLCRGQGCRFVPPRFSKYIEWGSSSRTANSCASEDGTIKLRVHQSSARYREANKVIGVIEGAHFYKVNCVALSDDGGILVSGGEDAAVNVLECTKTRVNGGTNGGQRVFKQLAKLVGHEDAVVSVAINKIFNVIVSGSMDCGAILWDLRTRAFSRELVGHSHSVDKVAINGANGNIITASSIEMRVWSINGDLLASVPSVQSLGLSSIASAISTRCESWQPGVVAVTGHVNGTIALWGLSYPTDLAHDKQVSSKSSTSTSAGTARIAVRVGRTDGATILSHSGNSNGSSSTVVASGAVKPAVLKVVPSCQLFVMKLLMDHRSSVTALTLSSDQRQLFSGDADGNCIRWVDDSISVNIL